MNRRDAETERVGERRAGIYRLLPSSPLLLFALCLGVSAVNLSCTTKPSDLRTLVPAETLVYLETNDLAAALQPIVDSKPFQAVAKSKPDFSALKGVQVAVAVTGFETSEVAVTDEHAVGKVQPRFVAVADTHAWNYQAVAFAEKKLGSFVADIYDGEPKLEKSDKHGGKYFTWSPPNNGDGRKAFALVVDSLIYFGNDETAIDKCLAVRRGEADSIVKTRKVPPRVPNSLANGYVSTDGVAQVAALAGIQFASQASDDEEVQSAIAGILPQLIRGTITEVSWSASQTKEGLEDKWQVTMPPGISETLTDTMASAGEADMSILGRLPTDVQTATVYNFRNPLIAWRFLLHPARRTLDPFSIKILEALSEGVLEEYGIADPERFFGARPISIVTVRLSDEVGDPVVVSTFLDVEKVDAALSKELRHGTDGIKSDLIKESPDDGLASFYRGNMFVVGSSSAVKKIHVKVVPDSSWRKPDFDSAVITVGRENSLTLQLISFLAREGHGDTQVVSTYLTETRFTKTGMERRTVSDFGFIGWMIAQLAAE